MLQIKKKPVVFTFKPKPPALAFKLKQEVEEHITDIIDETDLVDRVDGFRIACGIDWEIWVEPLNFVVRERYNYSYFSDFGQLLNYLARQKTKKYLEQYQLERAEEAMEEVRKEILSTCAKIRGNLSIVAERFGVNQTHRYET